MNVYEKKQLIKPGFFQRLFNKIPKQNFIIELENLLAENEYRLLSIKESDVNVLKEKYKVSEKDFKYEREFLLKRFISHCIWDEQLSETEKNQINHLAELLDISPEYVYEEISEQGKIIYNKKVKQVIFDGIIDDSEQAALDTLQKDFYIDDSCATKIRNKEITSKIQSYVNNLLQKQRISPDEEQKLNEMLSGLHINATASAYGIQKFRKYWDIENGELVPIESPINMQKNEYAYFSAQIDWYEEHTRTTSVSYAGITSRFRICKGVYLQAGAIAPSRNTEQYLKLIDKGIVYFTNKRIIFMGEHNNKTIPLSKILSFTPYTDGIEIEKDAGKKPFFKFGDSELMGMYLARLLKDY